MSNMHPLIIELHTLDRELARFEYKYGLLSETFYMWYQQGHEPEDPAWVTDFALWSGTYQLRLRRQEKYRRLMAESLARQDTLTLMREAVLMGTVG